MPYRRFRRRRSTSRSSRPRLQHSPSEMDGTINSKILSLRVLAKTDTLAGVALTADRTAADRFQEVATGSDINSVTTQIAIRVISNEGYLEYCIAKLQRSSAVPAVNTDPIPGSTDVDGIGLESSMRQRLPGWIIHNGIMPFSAETPTTRKFTVNLKKFKMSKFRDGDFLLLMLFNRSASVVTVDHKANYYEYK